MSGDKIIDVLDAVLHASIGLSHDPKLVPPRMSRVFSPSITGKRTRQVLQVIYENAETDEEKEDVLSYIFGLRSRIYRHVQSLELLTPAHKLWSSDAYQQNAWTMLNRTRTTLRANLLIALANHNEHLFLRYLFLFGCQERWRKGTVDHLAAWRDQLSTQAPEQACALAELTCPAIDCAVETISNFRSLAKEYGEDGEVPTFKSIYTALRYAGLFSRQDRAIDAADILCSARSKLPHDDSVESLMLRRALERSLHLLHLPEECGDFIDELLDWLADPQGEGAVFAAYTACYYLDSLDGQSWQGMIAPYSIEQPWTKKALHAVLEESNKNLTESWYRAPHQAATNMLRAINYLRAHPELRLGHRERIVCRCLANAGAAVASRLSHPRKAEVAQWSEWLKRWCFATS